jgi:diguanylate cyclase (GGDEF)-like protein
MKVEGYRRSGISTRALLKGAAYIAIGTITFALMALWFLDARARDIRISGRESTSQIMVDGIAIAIQDDVIARNFAQLESRLRQSMSDPQMVSIMVIDEDGAVLSQMQRDPKTDVVKPIYSSKKVLPPSVNELVVSSDMATTRWLELKAGVPIGWLKLEIASTLIDDKLIGLRRDMTIALLGACLILFISIGIVLRRTYSLIRIEEALMEGKSEALEKIAFHDHLTGLPNRLVLMDRIGQAIAYSDRGGKGFALCFMDLDGFKSINDTHGHHIGDVVLKEVAVRLKDSLRASDTVARIGGDEFVLLLVDGEGDDGYEILLDRLRKSVSEPIRLRSGKLLHVGLSIGVTTYPRDASPVADLLKHADQAMYQAKKSKEDKFVLYKI